MASRSGIYMIQAESGRQYIGSAACIKKRWKEHGRQLQAGKHHSRFLQRDWNKRGPGAFEFRVLVLCDRQDLLFYEQRFLDVYQPVYNTLKLAGSVLGYKHTPETRARMSASRPRDFSPMRGKKHTPEALAKISANRKGKGGGLRAPECLAKISAALKGRPHSAERKARISKTLTGTSTGRGKLTPEQVREIRRLDGSGLRQFEIAKEVSLPRHWVHTVVRGHAYGWVK